VVERAVPPDQPSGGLGVPERALEVLLAAWVVLASYLFFTPEPEQLTGAVDPSLGHVIVFAAIGGTAMARFRPTGPAAVGALFAVGVAGGIVVEVVQELLASGRSGQFADVVADAVGLSLGMAAVGAAHRLVRRPGLVSTLSALGSAALLLAISVVAAVGPAEVAGWWTGR
jgi:VanZ family protein